VSFASPWLLLGLAAIPLVVLGYLWLDRRRARRARAWTRPAMEPNIVREPRHGLRYVPAVLLLIGLTLLLVGFARPQHFDSTAGRGAPTIVLTFDVSGSMAADDVPPTRIQAAHAAAVRFLRALPAKYRVAVITFADKVRVLVPPTFDRRRAIAQVPDAITPKGGTGLGDAINQAVAVAVGAVGKSVPGNPYPPAAVLLVSDGKQTNVGTDPSDAAQQALSNGIPIDALAVGTDSGTVDQSITTGGQSSIQTIPVPVDTVTLQDVAQVTGGKFFQLGATAPSRLDSVYRNVGSHTTRGRTAHELDVAVAVGALVFILAGIGLSGFWFGRIA
jgi:Ca-activated chloride channel family protein